MFEKGIHGTAPVTVIGPAEEEITLIDAMLAATVTSNPNGTAIAFGRRELSYRELTARVAGFGQGLRSRGVGQGDHVLIVLPNCPEFVIGYFATARIAATVQAVDPALPEHELRHHVEQTAPAVLITTAHHAARLSGTCPRSCTVVVIGDGSPYSSFDDLVVEGAAPALGADPAGHSWVTALSSGSTGEAKRIGRSQDNQVAEADNIVTSARITSDDVILCPVPLFHALGQFCCMVTAVRAGATMVLLDHDSGKSIVEQILETIDQRRITIFLAVPYLFEALIGLPVDRHVDLSSARLCLSGSNFLPAAVSERFRARFGVPIRQTYGSTETGSVSWDLDPDATPNSVGKPLHGVTVQILDDEGHPLPVPTVGEIAVNSAAAVTAGRDGDGEFYRTGDLGRLDGAGRLYVIGRKRILIDTGGHKVNPIEVEDVLKKHPAVTDATVVGLPLRGTGDLLVAAVVTETGDGGTPSDVESLLAHCRARLAAYKIPQRMHFVRRIPRTPVGKVRRAHLSAMLAAAGDSGDPGLRARLRVLPRTRRVADLTEYLTARMADILRTAEVSIDPGVPLAGLGFDSLGALRLRMVVQDDLQLYLELPELLGTSSITSVAERLADLLPGSNTATTSPDVVPRGPTVGEFPLSASQLSLWHAEQVNPDNAVYVVAFAAQITSPCDVTALRRSFQLLVDRHPALRTTFPVRDGTPVQQVAEQAPVDFTVVDVPPDWDDTGRAALDEDAFRAFDIAAAPALRVRLYLGAARGPVLLLAQHHIITDYWSLIVMLRELAAVYAAESSGGELYLPPVPHTYTDYGRWLDEMMASPAGRDDLAYWLQRLQTPLPVADLPTDRERPVVRSQRGATLRQELPPERTAALRAYARSCGTTVYAVLLAAFHVLLHAHTGKDDSVIAVNTANRHRQEFGEVLGYFANPIVHRVQIDVNESFVALLDKVSTTLLADLDHQLVTFEQLIGKVGVHRDRGRAPLAEVGFGQNKAQDAGLADVGGFLSADEDGHRLRLGTLTLESIALRRHGVVYDLAGAVYESDESTVIVWEYDRDLFDRTTVRRMTDRFATVLRTITTAPDRLIRDLVVADDLTRTLLVAASRGAPLPGRLPPVTESIDRHAAAHPDSPAVEDDGAVLTYGELDARADGIAAVVREVITAGQAPGDEPVAIWVSSAAELAVVGLGVLRVGACCDPLDWGLDPDRVRTAVAEDAARLLITTTRRRDSLGAQPIPVICTDIEHSGRPGGTRSPLQPDSSALVLRTSGVEGPPRAVVADHHTLSAAAYQSRHGGDLRGGDLRGDVLLSDARTAGHTLATLLTVLASGDTAVTTPAGEFAAVIGSGRAIKSVAMTPTELARVLNHLDRTRTTPRVGTIVLSGEVLPARLVRRWREHTAGTRIIHQYWGAELGLAVSAGEVPPNPSGIIPVGCPTPGTSRYVLDDAARLCPTGVPGEVCIAEDRISRLLDDVLPAERFVPEPGAPGRRLYRTGDIGRYLPNGDLVVLGRAGQIGREHGYRSDPVRVEEALRTHPAVSFAVVAANGGQATVAHVELAGPPVTEAELREVLRRTVPHHLIPDDIVFTDRVPAADNGKSARSGLAGTPRQPVGEPTREPANPVETVLAAIWAEVLGRNHVGLDDDYYALGGDSVMTIRIATKAAEQGIQLTRRQLFTHPTVRALATVARTGVRPTALTRSLSRHRSIPLTPIQHWFFDQDFTLAQHWNQTIMVEASGPVDPTHLRAAMEAVADHHGTFRFRYRRRDNSWDQVSDPTGEVVGIAERTAHDPAELARVVADARSGIDIAAGPLLRMTIVRSGDGRISLVLVAHHLVMDFLSWNVVLDDLTRAYRQREWGEPVRLPVVPTPYDEWARQLHQYAHSPEVRRQLPYWAARAGSLSHPGPSDPGPSCERQATSIRRCLSRDETAGLLDALAAAGAKRVHDAVLASVVRAVARETRLSTVWVDLEGHGREDLFDHVDLTRTVGWFTALYPVAFSVEPALSPAGILAAVHTTLEQVPDHGLGYGLLRYACSDATVRERMAAVPRPRVSFNYLGRLGWLLGDHSRDQPPLFRPVPAPKDQDRAPDNRRPYQWEFSASLAGELISIHLRHAGDPRRAERMMDHVCGTLRAFITGLEPSRGQRK